MFRLAYLAGIFSALNSFCTSFQGRETDITSSLEKITAFKWKLYLWLKRVSKGSFDQFPKFSELRESMQVDKYVLSDIEDHLISLRSKLDSIFSTEKVAQSWVQNPFVININNAEENFQKKFFDLKASGTANKMFTASNLTEFWLSQTEVNKHISRIALNHPLPFAMHIFVNKDSRRQCISKPRCGTG